MFLIPLGLTAAAPADDAGIHKKIIASGNAKTLIILNDESEDIFKKVKYLEDSGLLKGVTETNQNELKEQKGVFLSMLLGKLDASLLGNTITGWRVNRAGEGIVRAGYGIRSSKMHF